MGTCGILFSGTYLLEERKTFVTRQTLVFIEGHIGPPLFKSFYTVYL